MFWKSKLLEPRPRCTSFHQVTCRCLNGQCVFACGANAESSRARSSGPSERAVGNSEALQRWKKVGEKLADLMALIGLRASVLDWLPSSSSQRWGLGSPDVDPSSTRRSAKETASDKQLEYKEITQQDQGCPQEEYARVCAPDFGAEGRGQPVQQRGLLRHVQESLGVPVPGGAPGEEEGQVSSHVGILRSNGEFDCSKLRADHVSVQEACPSLASQEGGSDQGEALLSLPRSDARVVPVGRQGAEPGTECAGDGGGPDGRLQRGGQENPKPGRSPCGSEDQGMEMRAMEKQYLDSMEAQTHAHRAEMETMRTQMAWTQGFMQQAQAAQEAQTEGFQMVRDP